MPMPRVVIFWSGLNLGSDVYSTEGVRFFPSAQGHVRTALVNFCVGLAAFSFGPPFGEYDLGLFVGLFVYVTSIEKILDGWIANLFVTFILRTQAFKMAFSASLVILKPELLLWQAFRVMPSLTKMRVHVCKETWMSQASKMQAWRALLLKVIFFEF